MKKFRVLALRAFVAVVLASAVGAARPHVAAAGICADPLLLPAAGCVDTAPVVTVIVSSNSANTAMAVVNTTGWGGLGRVHLEAQYYVDANLVLERTKDCAPNNTCSLGNETIACGDPATFHRVSVTARAWSLDNGKYGVVSGYNFTYCN